MNDKAFSQDEKIFVTNPEVIENYSLLQKIGVFKYIDSLHRELRNIKSLFNGALDIFNRLTIPEIMDAAAWQISDHFLPSFIGFIIKPLPGFDNIIQRGYKNYKEITLDTEITSLDAFESFFSRDPKPVKYSLLPPELRENEVLASLDLELVVPIMDPSGLSGLVLAGKKIFEDDYSPVELTYLQELLTFFSQAIQNHILYERTLRDSKTGLYNSGYFLTRLNEEINRTRRSDSYSSIIMIDIDHFKKLNDTYGHMAGDRVLEYLTQVIRQNIRGEDIASRFGGEEFIILQPDSSRKAALSAAERLRRAVENMEVEWETPLPGITISLGIFTFDKETNLPADEMIKNADEALYLSKAKGRNCSTFWALGLLRKIEKMNLK